MTGFTLRNLAAAAGCILLIIHLAVANAYPQSQALDGQIEGSVVDQNGAAVTGARVSATNTGTGLSRSAATDASGVYRIPLLPLGTYRLVAEAQNYETAIRDGLTLTTGQIVTLDFTLTPGEPHESVTVMADSPVTDAGKTDLGRVMTAHETKSLPLVARNPYNFVLQQANVNGRPSRGFQFPNISANGYLRRVNYLLDGNTATQADRAGVRLMHVSETFVKEVQLVSNAFAPEFGNTPGLIMNVVTPSGTNEIQGSAAYMFRLPSFYSRPFNYSSSQRLPDNRVHNVALKLGLPIMTDRWHLYGGYEQFVKDDKALPNRLLTITETNKAQLIAAGLPASIFPPAVPTLERGRFMLVRTDAQLGDTHRLAVRFNHSRINIENNIQGGLNTLERSIDTSSVDHAVASQLISYSTHLINEFRFQFVRRKVTTLANEFSGSGPTIMISNVANFGAPENPGSISPLEKPTQVQNNITSIRGAHVSKIGGGFIHINNHTRADVFARYTFPSITAYVSARNGTNPYSYSIYSESSGNPDSRYSSTFWNLFAQDDWKLTQRLKLTFGLRYDLYKVPDADTSAAITISRKFNVDKDNIAPRFAAVYALRQGERPLVLRVGAGLYYETPWLNMYERALRKNGNPTYFNFSVTPNSPLAPAFPTINPGGLQLPTQDIDTIAPDLENLYAIHANVQLEKAISTNASVRVGFVHSGGRHIAVYRSVNHIPIRNLADGRPVYSRLINSITRHDPRFNNIFIAESAGRSRYDALTIQFTARSLKGMQVSANYTLSKATDDAPEQNLANPGGANLVLSNPQDRSYDHGRSFADQRHTFVMSMVAFPTFETGNTRLNYLLNNNKFAMIAMANSGQAFNIVSNLDLNNDTLLQDRPLGISRNAGTTPPLFNLDLRYSRFVSIRERFKLEFFAEFTNLFNINSIVQFNNVTVATNNNGELLGPIPDFRTRNQSVGQESRQSQLGIRLTF
jgi:hypothetical protein